MPSILHGNLHGFTRNLHGDNNKNIFPNTGKNVLTYPTGHAIIDTSERERKIPNTRKATTMKTTVANIIAAADARKYNDYMINDGIERRVSAKEWEKDGNKRTYITIQCFTINGKFKASYKCGYVDMVSGEYVVTKYDDIDLTTEYRKTGANEWIKPQI